MIATNSDLVEWVGKQGIETITLPLTSSECITNTVEALRYDKFDTKKAAQLDVMNNKCLQALDNIQWKSIKLIIAKPWLHYTQHLAAKHNIPHI